LREEIIGRRYAKALIAIAKDRDKLEETRVDLTKVVSVFNEQELFRRVMCDPVYSKERRKAILEEVLKRMEVGPLCKRLCFLLVDKERIRYVPAVLDAYMKLEDEAAGRVRTKLSSAYPLPDDNVEAIRKALEQRLGKRVVVEVEVDPGLIAGVMCKVDGMVFDGSVRTQIETLQSALRGE